MTADTPTGPTADLLDGLAWECGSTAPGACADPAELTGRPIEWLTLTVPGTVAGALRASGSWQWGSEDRDQLDGRDWWFRCTFDAAGAGPWRLDIGGLATLADVWLNGTHLLHSENMFLAHAITLDQLAMHNELVLRCASLDAALAQRHPRPRWKSRLLREQSLRWYRTTLLGRMPGWSRWAAPVGPWLPIRLHPIGDATLVGETVLHTTCDDDGPGGEAHARIELHCADAGEYPATATLHVGDHNTTIQVERSDGRLLVQGSISLPAVERWWPHTHGSQPLYPVALDVAGHRHDLGRVGFRKIEVDRSDGGFRLVVNGVSVFCRGACWASPDAVSFAPSRDAIEGSLRRARDAGMNMLRVGGYTSYETEDFWDACDELGLLVWQDCMFASSDPPATTEFIASAIAEVRQVFSRLARRPSLALACGSSETYQQAAMFGLPASDFTCLLLEETIPAALREVVPGLPYLSSSPSGGDPPFTPGEGVAHYFGVGAYLRPPSDARFAGVRFAAECLAFGTPPERETIDEVFESAAVAGHDPRWKQTVARDAGTAWDFEDVCNHYARELFGIDPLAIRHADPERALDYSRASVCELMSTVLADWRTGGHCDGALVLCLQDLWPGAGWGLVDALGRPKAPLFALRRVFAPTAVLITDEGLAGLHVHVMNDGPDAFSGRLSVRALTDTGAEIERAERDVVVDSHGALGLGTSELFNGFRDLNYAYRFGPLTYDVVVAELFDAHARRCSETYFLPAGAARPRLPGLGLEAHAARISEREWMLECSSDLFAQYVSIDAHGFEPSDSWFHLAPHSSRAVLLRANGDERQPHGSVRALNGPTVRIAVDSE